MFSFRAFWQIPRGPFRTCRFYIVRKGLREIFSKIIENPTILNIGIGSDDKKSWPFRGKF